MKVTNLTQGGCGDKRNGLCLRISAFLLDTSGFGSKFKTISWLVDFREVTISLTVSFLTCKMKYSHTHQRDAELLNGIMHIKHFQKACTQKGSVKMSYY